ncbi:hypothetical protein [Desulfogranum mediterraneum]|uniref:hypothetical protein n=1 Tax=Desulfogranum mediterraneum TaxID=160661 RepID=UPI0003FA66AD|nr:hypothetical protein [Desulfogranum mediterraneum]
MKKAIISKSLTFSTLFLACSVTPLMAAKPMDIITLSNGYPSGAHYNLNIHGKSDFLCDGSSGGGSVFISEYGDSTISYITNRKSSVTELIALDRCGEAFDGDPAQVQIPYEQQGYYVYADIKGKPNNGNNDKESSVILYPNLVREACNDTDPLNPDFGTYSECPDSDQLALGLIVGDNVYEATDIGFVRFNSENSGGKGKSKAKDISSLFKYTGYVFDASLDISLDGEISNDDVPLSYDALINGGNGDGVIDQAEFDRWLAEMEAAGLVVYYENEWILNIADLVVTDQLVSNDGTKLLKIRFYPVATTEYLAP